jgi:ADP-heptose:LPS heptosyltransferase
LKILLFKIGALGDILMTTPLIRQLRKKYPDAQIDYLCGKSFSQIIINNKNLNNSITFDENIIYNKKIFKCLNLIKKIKLKKYNKIYVLDKHWIFSLFSFLSKIKERIGFYRDFPSKIFLTKHIKYKTVKHEIYYYLSLLNKYNKTDTKLDFYISNNDEKKIKKYLKNKQINKFIVFINSGGDNPGEKNNIRKLSNREFLNELEKINYKNNNIILVGGKNDKKYYDEMLKRIKNNQLKNKIFNVAGKFNLRESTAIMKYAKNIKTTDCGAMHLASTVNKKLSCYFKPTNPKRKAPLIKNIKIIWKNKNKYNEKYDLYGKIN